MKNFVVFIFSAGCLIQHLRWYSLSRRRWRKKTFFLHSKYTNNRICFAFINAHEHDELSVNISLSDCGTPRELWKTSSFFFLFGYLITHIMPFSLSPYISFTYRMWRNEERNWFFVENQKKIVSTRVWIKFHVEHLTDCEDFKFSGDQWTQRTSLHKHKFNRQWLIVRNHPDFLKARTPAIIASEIITVIIP